MTSEILFEEVQAADRKKTIDFFKVTAGIFAVALLINLIVQQGDFSYLTTILFVGFFICVIAGVLSHIQLVTQIRTDGIYVRYPPFLIPFNKYSWENIKEIYIINFDPMIVGRGIRMSPWGKAYIFSGDVGIQIVLKNGAKFLIGTQCPDEMAETLNKFGKFRRN